MFIKNKLATKENAYITALESATISHTVMRMCNEALLINCDCGRALANQWITGKRTRITNKNRLQQTYWRNGCKEQLQYVFRYSRKLFRKLIQDRPNQLELIVDHNARAGQEVSV